jgi:hypothetical protein
MMAASTQAVRSFDDEVRSADAGAEEGDSSRAPRLPDIRKIDALQDWLKACQLEKERESS